MVPVEKNKEYEIKIESVASEGNGVGHIDGFAVFVPDTVDGDVVKALIVKVNKNYAFGKVLKIITPSDKRVESVCPVSGKCGGCQLMHIDYSHQLLIKENIIKDALKRIGGQEDYEFLKVYGMENPYEYRNKTQVPFKEKKGKIKYGFYKEGKNEKYNPYLAVNDLLVYGSNFVCEYAETMQIVNKNVKSRSSVKDLSDVKFSIIDLYTRVVIETYSNITVDEEQYKVLENSENMDLMNKHFKIENSYVETKDDYSLNNLRFAEEYSSCDKQTFAQNLSENVKNISGITSTSTTLEKATFYFKQVYGIGG